MNERALTVKQPWASAILNYGKDVENRSRPTKYRGWLYIHAGVAWDERGIRAIEERYFGSTNPSGLTERSFTRGAIIGRVRVVGCVTNSSSPWAVPGLWHWLLADPEPLVEPVPCRGMLGLWTPPAEIAA